MNAEEREQAIQKFIAKFKIAYPDRPQPTYEEVAAYVDERIKQGRHITYPMIGLRNWKDD